MESREAIEWLELLKQKNIEFDDYSEDTKEIREEATRRYQKSLSLGIQALEKQKTGHWIRKNDICTSRVQLYQFECSNCREINTFQGKYCPDCGAKMEGEKE